jgi:hypothetical protein
MSIFGTIMSKIFGTSHAEAAPAAGGSAPTSAAASAAAAPASVDVDAVVSALAAKHSEKLDWKHSIVDLLKVLGLDSSLTARKTLADELHYAGDKNDTATMNMWLSKQVMKKLAENGGKLPDDLKH